MNQLEKEISADMHKKCKDEALKLSQNLSSYLNTLNREEISPLSMIDVPLVA